MKVLKVSPESEIVDTTLDERVLHHSLAVDQTYESSGGENGEEEGEDHRVVRVAGSTNICNPLDDNVHEYTHVDTWKEVNYISIRNSICIVFSMRGDTQVERLTAK
jgi:hypothetical protein